MLVQLYCGKELCVLSTWFMGEEDIKVASRLRENET